MDLQDLEQRNKELSILNAIAQDLNRGISLEAALNTTLQQVVHLFNLKTGWIWFFDRNDQKASLAASYNLPPAFIENPDLLKGSCWCIEKYLDDEKMEKAFNINEITCSRLKDLTTGTDGLRFHASIPLYSRSEKIGLMNVVSTDWQKMSKAHLQLLYTIGDMLSIAIERARLFERSKMLGMMEERNRLAREIHDTVAQGLSAISLKVQASSLLLDLDASKEKIKNTLDQILTLTQDNLKEVRQSVLNLRASPLLEATFIEAIEKLLEETEEECDVKTSLLQMGEINSLPLRIEMGLYRIIQEAINNVVKHANAKVIAIQIDFLAEIIQVKIEDNGKGFDINKKEPESFGLVGINERVNLLGGVLEIQSSLGLGTVINVQVPLDRELMK